MKHSFSVKLNLIALSFLSLLFITASGFKIDEKTKQKFKYAEQNENCLKCHGQVRYSFESTEDGRKITKKMCSSHIVNRDRYYDGVHAQFKCFDCHSEDYDTFPHPGRLRMEMGYNCIDCHGGDPDYAKYHFEDIETEFNESIHAKKHNDDYSCWMCHNPHSYKLMKFDVNTIGDKIKYDNQMCLACHSNPDNYQMFVDKSLPDIDKVHDWLPNQSLHFKSVRCIECHAKTNDSIMVAHNIMPKKNAVKKCVECHSSNSILMSSLYKFQAKESRNKNGFINGVIMNESYVIGANRNTAFTIFTIAGFPLTIAGIGVHSVLRIIKRKNNAA